MSVETRASASRTPATESGLRIRLLGEIGIEREGAPVALPASRRTRALLGFLVAGGARHSREALCDLLWEGPDDPRAALRWSLAKLRPLVNDERERLCADRDWVWFLDEGASVDVRRLSALIPANLNGLPIDEIERAAATLRGEFLYGLALPACYRFHHWREAEQERWGALRKAVLAAALARLEDSADRALPYARELVALDPLAEAAHAGLVRLLAAAGRQKDAVDHYDHARALLERELDAPLSGELKRPAASRGGSAGRVVETRPVPPTPAPRLAAPFADVAMVGRMSERSTLGNTLAAFASAEPTSAIVILGESGIGKSKLLDFVARASELAGLRVLVARCFEAESLRPFGCWSDALANLIESVSDKALKHDLGALLPTGRGSASDEGGRNRLFSAVARLLEERPERIVLTIDDIHWIDEASASLLHYLLRNLGPTLRLLLIAAARADELEDNPWARRILSTLAERRASRTLLLAPLSAGEAAEILGEDATALEIAAAHRQSGGNPLYLFELARARQNGVAPLNADLSSIIQARTSRLSAADRELLVFAAAMGRDFAPETIGAAMEWPAMQLLESIERLERACLLKPGGAGRFDFAHDLIRQATYQSLSPPRRRLVHQQIARALESAARADPSLFGELLHHAAAAGDDALAVTAAIAAGEHSLRVYAYAAANEIASRGLWHLERLPVGPERARRHVALLKVKVFAGASPGAHVRNSLKEEVAKAVAAAENMGLSDDDASLAWHLIAWTSAQANDASSAGEAILRAEALARSGDAAAHCQQLASTGRCLFEVEQETASARAFLDQAAELAAALKLNFVELEWGRGLVARWDGDLVRAEAAMRRALALARQKEERWRETECLVWLAKIALEAGHFADASAFCAEVDAIAKQIGDEPSPVAGAVRALATLGEGMRLDDQEVAARLERLRARDDKAQLAYALNGLAERRLEEGRFVVARSCAAEALLAAKAVNRQTEIIAAAAILTEADRRSPDRAKSSDADVSDLKRFDRAELSARARKFFDRAKRSYKTPTLVQTAPNDCSATGKP